jgi:phosphohistidine swiveling domain-containing protein
MKYKSTDYYLLFQTNGVNFFFTDLCTRYYDKFKGVTLSLDNQWRYYVHASERMLAKGLYESFYKDVATVEASSQRFLKVVHDAGKSRQQLETTGEISLQDFETFIAQSAILLNEYSIFDHMYTDYLFTDSRVEVPALIRLVQEKKNVFREYMNQLFFNEDSYLMLVMQKIAQQKGLEVDELLYASIDYVLVRDNGEFVLFFGEEAQEFINDFLKEESLKDTEKEEVQGISVAKKGIYRGKVKKISIDYSNLQQSVSLLNEVEEGVVLVTESTVPEMLSVMSRSLAVVTDMGGMLSHASITCRELGIPCIIGTKIATQILRDGDLVEVDAEQGIVKIIKRA